MNLAVHKSFLGRADSAAFFEAWVGASLARLGLFTLHRPFTLAEETGFDVSDYANSWDLDVGPHPASLVPVDVKSVNLTFTGPYDYPFPTILLCSRKAFERRRPGKLVLGHDFITVSRNTGKMVWVPSGTPITFKTITDSTRGETFESTCADRQHIRSIFNFVKHMNRNCEQ